MTKEKRNKVQLVTTASRKARALLPKAIANTWSAARLSREAGVCAETAASVLREHETRYLSRQDAALDRVVDKRVMVARDAQDKALARLPGLQNLLDRAEKILLESLPRDDGTPGTPVALDSFGEPIPIDPERIIKAMGGLVKAGKDLHSYMEQATGLDVVKAVSVRQQTQGSGPVTSWDGVGSLESSIEAEAQIVPIESQEEWI